MDYDPGTTSNARRTTIDDTQPSKAHKELPRKTADDIGQCPFAARINKMTRYSLLSCHVTLKQRHNNA